MRNKVHKVNFILLAVTILTQGCAIFQPSVKEARSRLLSATYSIVSNEQIVVTLINCADTAVLVHEPPDSIGMNYRIEFEGVDGEIEEFSNDYVVTLDGSRIVPLAARRDKNIVFPNGTMSFMIRSPKPMKCVSRLICYVRRMPLPLAQSIETYGALEACFLDCEEEIVATPIL